MITIPIKQLKAQLAILTMIVSRKSALPILSTILIESGDNKCSITGTDLDTYYLCDIEAKCTKAEKMIVNPRLLQKIVRSTDAEVVELEARDTEVFIRAGQAEWIILSENLEHWPNVPEREKSYNSSLVAGDKFKRAMRFTKFAVTEERSRFTLSTAKTLINDSLTMVTTNGHQLAFYNEKLSKSSDSDFNEMIEAKDLNVLIKLKTDYYHIRRSLTHFFIDTDQGMLITRKPNGSFPNYEMVMPDKDKLPHTITFKIPELLRAMTQLAFTADFHGGYPAMHIQIFQDRAIASSVRPFDGSLQIPLSATINGGVPTTLGFNPEYLIDFLKLIGDGEVQIRWADPNTQTEWTAVADQDYEYKLIVMPLRI